jgi:hypothetical protein
MIATTIAQAANQGPYTMGQNTMGQNTTPSPPQSYYPGHASPQTPPSSNQSPTSYHAHLHVRQLRPQKQPLYTPACLRPTESSRPQNIPGPRMPDTPPSSKQSSLESGNIGLGSPEASKKSAQDADLDMLRLGLSRAALTRNTARLLDRPPWHTGRYVERSNHSQTYSCCVCLQVRVSLSRHFDAQKRGHDR